MICLPSSRWMEHSKPPINSHTCLLQSNRVPLCTMWCALRFTHSHNPCPRPGVVRIACARGCDDYYCRWLLCEWRWQIIDAPDRVTHHFLPWLPPFCPVAKNRCTFSIAWAREPFSAAYGFAIWGWPMAIITAFHVVLEFVCLNSSGIEHRVYVWYLNQRKRRHRNRASECAMVRTVLLERK